METMRMLGKGPGFFLVAIIIVGGLFGLSAAGKDVASLTGPLGAFVAAYYGAGFAKRVIDKVAEVKKTNGKG